MDRFFPFIVFICLIFMSYDANAMIEDSSKVNHYTQVVDNYLKGLNTKDLSLILSLYSDSATVEDPVGSQVIKGMDSLRMFYSGAVNMDLELTRMGAVRVAGNEAAFPFELIMMIDGKKTRTEIIDVFKFNADGKIISMRAFWGIHNRTVID